MSRLFWNINAKVFLLLIVIGYSISCNSVKGSDLANKTNTYKETFSIMTDRSVYAINESVYFKVLKSQNLELEEEKQSKVLYLELLDNTGKSYFKSKYRLTNKGAYGSFIIPEDLLTGNYYIVVYTKWMQNFTDVPVANSVLTIINPYTNSLSESSIIEKISDVDKNTKDSTTSSSLISINQKTFKMRDKVEVAFKLPNEVKSEDYIDISVSVIKSATYSPNMSSDSAIFFVENDPPGFYFPEYRGLTFSGKVRDVNSGKSAAAFVNMTILDDHPIYMGVPVNADGRFIFSLPDKTGVKNIFANATSVNDDQIELLIDTDFSTKFWVKQSVPFSLTSEQIDIAEEIITNMQLAKYFDRKLTRKDTTADSDIHTPFYGNTDNFIYLKDYISLPNLEEVFFEVVKGVVVDRKRNSASLKVFNYKAQNYMDSPLILLDWIYIDDQAKLLALSPENIEKIEVVNEYYIKGERMYGGIVNITSKNGKLGGYKLNGNSFFFDYMAYGPDHQLLFPDYSTGRGERHQPDIRNCLYWNPNLKLTLTSPARFDFYTSDQKGEYIILIRGKIEGEIKEWYQKIYVE